jgi:hypothetical protein
MPRHLFSRAVAIALLLVATMAGPAVASSEATDCIRINPIGFRHCF